MKIKIGINGMGRIGRMVVRSIFENNNTNIEIKHINNRTSSEACCTLLKYDSIHGKFKADISFDDEHLIINQNKIDLIVLARYMQVLSPSLCKNLKGKIINIHHSFLPSFKGARPYNQAYMKGVKIIGATAHYVTDKLDEGQIIEQDVGRVDHTKNLEDFVSMGRDIENVVLLRAIKWHIQHRLIINNNGTIVFN